MNDVYNNLTSFSKNVMDEIHEIISKQSHFILCHPDFLKELNPKHFRSNVYFIPNVLYGLNSCSLVKQNFLKKQLYGFYLENKDKCLRGEG